jgi:glutamyl-Q tRNA(Asp) synthetase
MTFVTRFAPSPTGRLHLGHAFSALTAYRAARAESGRFILRIEDIDQGRCRPEYEAGIFEDLDWLGIKWENPVRRQSDHLSDYSSALQRLQDLGVLYRCFRTRREIAEQSASAPHIETHDPPPPASENGDKRDYPGADTNQDNNSGRPFAWRLSISAARHFLGEAFNNLEFISETPEIVPDRRTIRVNPELLDDVILGRKDAPSSYHLAVVHDDALQGVSHVIRGDDLLEATHVQVLLQTLLGLPTPVYRHHRLLTGEDGKRYAKRNQSLTLAALRAQGVTPEAILRRLDLVE